MGIENPVHLLFIAAVALVVLGPRRLPELARSLGKGIREFREAMSDGSAVGTPHAPASSARSPPTSPPSARRPRPSRRSSSHPRPCPPRRSSWGPRPSPLHLRRSIRASLYVRAIMRLIVARCEVSYIGRTTTVLPEAVRLLMLKADGTFMVWADGGSPNVRPLNWMTPPTVLEEERSGGGGGEDPDGDAVVSATANRMGCSSVWSCASTAPTSAWRSPYPRCSPTSTIPVDDVAALEKEGLERELQELLADAPHWCGEGFRLVRREWPTDIGPVDLMCRDTEDEWVAVEIKRIATMESVQQLTRYLERIRLDPAMASCRGVLVAKWIKPQARVLAGARGIDCVEVDIEVLRGNREPELTLFAA